MPPKNKLWFHCLQWLSGLNVIPSRGESWFESLFCDSKFFTFIGSEWSIETKLHQNRKVQGKKWRSCLSVAPWFGESRYKSLFSGGSCWSSGGSVVWVSVLHVENSGSNLKLLFVKDFFSFVGSEWLRRKLTQKLKLQRQTPSGSVVCSLLLHVENPGSILTLYSKKI